MPDSNFMLAGQLHSNDGVYTAFLFSASLIGASHLCVCDITLDDISTKQFAFSHCCETFLRQFLWMAHELHNIFCCAGQTEESTNRAHTCGLALRGNIK